MFGISTEVLAMLASPGRVVSTVVSFGLAVRLKLLPESRRDSFGLKPRRRHSPSWNRSVRAAVLPRVESSDPSTLIGSQEVGFLVNSFLSSWIATDRTSRGIPSRI